MVRTRVFFRYWMEREGFLSSSSSSSFSNAMAASRQLSRDLYMGEKIVFTKNTSKRGLKVRNGQREVIRMVLATNQPDRYLEELVAQDLNDLLSLVEVRVHGCVRT